jgi:hypothetical protein
MLPAPPAIEVIVVISEPDSDVSVPFVTAAPPAPTVIV